MVSKSTSPESYNATFKNGGPNPMREITLGLLADIKAIATKNCGSDLNSLQKFYILSRIVGSF